jgi:hypothetical protein
MHAFQPLVPETISFEGEIPLKRYKLPVIDHIPAELIQAGGSTLHSNVNKHQFCSE